MGDHRAIEAACRAVVRVLTEGDRPADIDKDLKIELFGPTDFTRGITGSGVSVYLYRVSANPALFPAGGPAAPDAPSAPPPLALDLRYLLTIWAPDVVLQHRIAGWLMRRLHENPLVPFTFLDSVAPGVFHQDETIELLLEDLSNKDLFRIWSSVSGGDYHLSIPYLARRIQIDARAAGGPADAPARRRYLTG